MNFISADVAVPGLNRDFAYSRSMLIADQTILRLFEDTVSPLHQQMELLKRQVSAFSRTLPGEGEQYFAPTDNWTKGNLQLDGYKTCNWTGLVLKKSA